MTFEILNSARANYPTGGGREKGGKYDIQGTVRDNANINFIQQSFAFLRLFRVDSGFHLQPKHLHCCKF